ncbi:TIGR02301 family protein [Phenylobacterium sp.]|uniref:TIGR02301 family protein n=1 Tax=Phenylobacterium sp. TaxID=1871053 RepID=UPI0035B4F4CC
MRRLVVLAVLALAAQAWASSAWSQERTPAQRQSLADLAYVLGESHALRQACHGEGDQFWRARMIRLLEVETPDENLDRRLREAFNTGFSSARAAHPQCDASARADAARVAAEGQGLAARLSQVMAPPKPDADSPDSIEAPLPPR